MHLEQAITLYDAAEHRPLATRFGQDAAVHALSYGSLALWSLGYPEAAEVDIDQAISDAREISQAATLMTALNNTGVTHICCRITRQQTRHSENLSLWRTKKAPCIGRCAGWRRKVAFLLRPANPRTQSVCLPPGSPHIVQREQHCGRLSICQIWRHPMRASVN